MDGGSHDGTLAILERTKGAIDRPVSEPDGGIYDAMNKGIGLASGDVIGFLNADDCYAHAGVLSRLPQLFSEPE